MTLSTVILAIGLAVFFEGLVLALAPRRVEEFLVLLAQLGVEARRLLGLLALVFGAMIATLSHLM